MTTPKTEPLDEESRWVTLHVHERQVAIDEGILVPYQLRYESEVVEVCFTDRLYAAYHESPAVMHQITKDGLDQLKIPDPSDTEYMRVRTVREDEVLVVQDRYGITFMEPSDF